MPQLASTSLGQMCSHCRRQLHTISAPSLPRSIALMLHALTMTPSKLAKVQYKVIGNKAFCFVAEVVPHCGKLALKTKGKTYGTSANNIGNRLEHLAWLSLETDWPEMALALAWHTQRL